MASHCLCQHLLLKPHVFVLGSCVPPFHSPAPTSRSAGQSFLRGTHIWQQHIPLGLQAAPPAVSCSGPAWGAGEALAAGTVLPWGSLPTHRCHHDSSAGRQKSLRAVFLPIRLCVCVYFFLLKLL
uniref:Uncharacterized protein n=1 Tax=Buteo japonicus TaxID=224669 RepID=A0A8C0BZH9_9AVES